MTARGLPAQAPVSRAPAATVALALVLALAAAAVVVGAGIGARRGAWDFLSGLRAAEWAVWGAVAALALALVGLARRRRSRGAWAIGLIAIVFSAPVVVAGVQWKIAERIYPSINDISTDTADAPVFWDMPTPTDYPGRQVAELQRAAYPDIVPLELSVAPAQAYARALALVRERGWTVVASVPEEGRIEATVESRLYGFVDEVAIRVQPRGAASVVDVRSRSRLGRIDRGVNAKRIRALLADLRTRGG
ncbi:MAG: DUF1499 domain-containing protein [Burkholderiaceae bacterium]|jgi:uncharacterized protein (DUF1499 family)|nr:DUF1499 domain-containing protein [Burkholderiaceae bacterium]